MTQIISKPKGIKQIFLNSKRETKVILILWFSMINKYNNQHRKMFLKIYGLRDNKI
jgi:hypothetical protein